MDKYEQRRLALAKLVENLGRGGIATVAASIEKDASYVSRMLYEPGKAGRKRIGEDSWDALTSAYPQLSGNSPAVASATSHVRIQHLDIQAGMGDGRSNADYPETIDEMVFNHTYIRSLLGFVPKAGRLALVTGRGDSMMPTIAPGEILLVDTGITYFEHDGIYMINPGNGLQVKRLIDRGTAVYVCSDNQNPVYKDFPLPDEAVIVGKVFLCNRLERLA